MTALRWLFGVSVVSHLCMLTSVVLSSGPCDLQNNTESVWQNFTIDCNSNTDSSQCHCLTLNEIAIMTSEISCVNITINESQLLLTRKVEFRGKKSLIISGESTIISCTENNSGLSFRQVDKLTITNVTVTNCSTSTSRTAIYYHALCLVQCGDVIFTNVNVTGNNATGVSILNHRGGTVNFTNCNFIENSIISVEENKTIRGGGGVYIGNFRSNLSILTAYYFNNCLFARNIAHTRFYHFVFTDELGQTISGFGRGGGVFLAFEHPLTDIYAVFSNCTFLENAGFLGGGLSVEIEGHNRLEVRNISVVVENSLFEANGCNPDTPSGSGGGVHLNYNTVNKQRLSLSRFHLVNVTFTNNCAELGGGAYFFSDHRESNEDNNALLFENCTFTGNQAHTGNAIDLTLDIFDRLADGFLLTPTIKNCRFLSNINIHSLTTDTTFGTGTLYSSQYSIRFEGHTEFFNNSGTALYMVNGFADFSDGNVTFSYNTGIRGGAVALIGLSFLLVGTESKCLFVNNTAMDRGGAIFSLMFDKHDYTVSRSCFIRYFDSNDRNRVIPMEEWSANIKFTGNRARAGVGHAIFVTSLYPCQVINNGTGNKIYYIIVNITDVFSVRRITFSDEPQPQVATEGAILYHDRETPLQVIPGEQFNHRVTLSDDMGNPVEATFQASINNNPSIKVDSAFSLCLSDQITLKGEPRQSAQLFLQTASPRQTHIELEIKLKNCPPGFILEEDECFCYAHLYTGFLKCDTSTLHSYLISGFWTGVISDEKDTNKTELVTGSCPPGYCDYNGSDVITPSIKLPQNTSLLDKAICGRSRTGVLCGDCRKGYTSHFHSPNFLCKPVEPTLCKIGWIFYILSELVPVTVVFLLVLILNISFTSGALNGFILFSQLIYSLNINIGLHSNSVVMAITEGYKVIYGFFNLDYFNVETLSFCLWTKASALDMIAFKYITIVYAFVLIVAVVWFMNKCAGRCLGKWYRITKLKTSVIHGLSTFLVICYAQCVNVSLTLLLRYQYNPKVGSQLKVPGIVWLNGNLGYFSGKHLLYALPALACMLTIGVLPPVFLLSYPLINKVLSFLGLEGSEPVLFVSRTLSAHSLKPLLDSFQGCFKDNLRFFAGLYFLYRWIGLIVNASTSNSGTFFIAVEILLLCVLALHAICQPYTVKVHNIVDTLLFTNLAIINAISFANYHQKQTQQDKVSKSTSFSMSAVLQLVLIYMPVAVLMFYTLFKLCKCFLKHKVKKTNISEEPKVDNTTSSKVSKLKFLLNSLGSTSGKKVSKEEEELPHRLVADYTDANHSTIASDTTTSMTAQTEMTLDAMY